MRVHAIAADEQLTVYYGPGLWRLQGPDGNPVFEARGRTVYYHSLFGRWRDLPPGNSMSADGIDSVQVRWDHGWAVGIVLKPHGIWRRLVRWEDSRQKERADEIAQILSVILNRPFQLEVPGAGSSSTSVDRERSGFVRTGTEFESPEYEIEEFELGDQFLTDEPVPAEVVTHAVESPVYMVEDASDVPLPLRLGGGAILERDESNRLVLTIPQDKQAPVMAMTLLGACLVGIVAITTWILSNGFLQPDVARLLVGISMIFTLMGGAGFWLLWRTSGGLSQMVTFDASVGKVRIQTYGADGQLRRVPIDRVHGIRIRGEAVRTSTVLAYQRSVLMMMDSEDVVLFRELRPSKLPHDPAVMPALADLRRQADAQAGPSLARAGARVLAWYLDVSLADE